MSVQQDLQWLSQQLYPNGRAFRMPEGGDLFKLHEAINENIAQLDTDTLQILNDILPDNPDFDIDDAHDWYRRLGLYDSGTVPLADMKQAIAQKQSFPQVPLDKQNVGYITDQLQAAGFNVFVYKNKFSDGMGGFVTNSPSELLGIATGLAELGGFNLGELNLGSQWADDGITIIANYLEEDKDAVFDFGDNLRSTFYVGGNPVGDFADVPLSRKIEFRQLLIKLKAGHIAGFLLINYV